MYECPACGGAVATSSNAYRCVSCGWFAPRVYEVIDDPAGFIDCEGCQ